MDQRAVIELQMHGQDIPWLLAHWAEQQARPPGARLGAVRGRGPTRGPTPSSGEATRRLAAGLRRPGDRPGRQGPDPRRQLPRDGPGLAGLRHRRRRRGHDQHASRSAAEIAYFVEQAAVRRRDHPARLRSTWSPRPAPDLRVGRGHRATTVPTPDVIGDRPSLFAATATPTGRAGRSSRCCPFGIMFTSGTTNRPKAVVHTHANAVWASRIGPRNIDLGTDDRYLIYLPFFHVNAQSWSIFSVLGVGATAVLMPKWSTSRFWDVVAAQRHHPHLADAVRHRHAHGRADQPETDAARRRVRADHAGCSTRCSASRCTPPTA